MSLAAIIRSGLDADPVGGGDAYYGAALNRRVDTLVPDQDDPHKQKPLDFREACNKVLHASNVEPEIITTSRGTAAPLSYLSRVGDAGFEPAPSAV